MAIFRKEGLGRLLIRGERNWDIIDDVYPISGEYIVDKPGKGAFGQSNLPLILKNLGITHLIITGITNVGSDSSNYKMSYSQVF